MDIVEGEATPYLDEILEALTQDRFVAVLDGFIDRECSKFLAGGAGEYTLEQTESHANFVRLYGALISHATAEPFPCVPAYHQTREFSQRLCVRAPSQRAE